jgi:SAM-dependent methyltransferase
MDNFQAYSHYYDLFYSEKDYPQEVEYVQHLLKKFQSRKIKNLLELGSGSGQHAALFIERGYTVTGIEKSEEMVAQAKAKNIAGFDLHVGDICNFQLEQKFDAAVALFHVISYLPENKKLIACFENVYKHLHEGGLFIFDSWYTPAVMSQLPEPRMKQLLNDSVDIIRFAHPVLDIPNNIVHVDYSIFIMDKNISSYEVLKERHSMRHFGIPEIKLLAKLSGFRLVHAEAFLTGQEPNLDSWGVCFILKKSCG